ncbi:MAG: carboxymuconolactone decarboxylase family protein [Acidimicrobiales bacterium]
MHQRRPTSPRVPPIEKVAVKAREAMANGPANAVNVIATLHTNRTVNTAFGAFAQTILFKGSVDARLREIVILRMGWNCQAVYEFGQHTLFGRSVGLTDAEIYLITRPIGQGNWTDVERALIQMTDDLYSDDCVSDATWAELEQRYNHSEIIEFMAGALCYRVVSGLLNSCGVQLDDGVPGWPEPPTA